MRIRNILCIVLLLGTQQTIADTRSDSALSIFQNSSAEIRIEQFSSLIARQYSNMVSDASSNQNIHAQILNAIENAYHPQYFQKHILQAIDKTLNWQERNKIIQWLDTPLGRKASLAEALALMNASRDGISATIDGAKGLESRSKSALVDVVEIAAMESALQLDITVFQTSASSFAANAPLIGSDQSRSTMKNYSTFLNSTDSRRAEIANLNMKFSRSVLAIAYSDFSKPEMKALISFWGSPTGTRYSVALRDGINSAFNEANRNFNREVQNIVSASTLASAE